MLYKTPLCVVVSFQLGELSVTMAAAAAARTTKGGDVSPLSVEKGERSVKDNRCSTVISSPRARKGEMKECDASAAPGRDAMMSENVAAAVLPAEKENSSGREKLKRHWTEVAGRVLVPEKWGEEGLLREWMDYSSFDALLAPKGLLSAREALISQAKRACSTFFKSQ